MTCRSMLIIRVPALSASVQNCALRPRITHTRHRRPAMLKGLHKLSETLPLWPQQLPRLIQGQHCPNDLGMLPLQCTVHRQPGFVGMFVGPLNTAIRLLLSAVLLPATSPTPAIQHSHEG